MQCCTRVLALAGMVLFGSFQPAGAAGFAVQPVLVETKDGSGSLSVSNPGDQRLYIEASIFRWSHDPDGKDMLERAADAIASPPATWIEAGAAYNFRIRVPKAEAGKESSYRVLVTQVPSRSEIVSGQVTMAVTQSIPVFAEPPDLLPPLLTGAIAGTSQLLLRNRGGRRLKVVGITQGGELLAQGLVGYVLGQSALLVRLAGPIHAGRVDVMTDLGPRPLDLKD
jgi:fimbrial chaperone protein